MAVGRGPVTAGLGYEEAGVTMDRGFVLTDERCRTNVDGVFAVGDIVPGLQLAHRGFAQGIFVAEEIAGLRPAAIDELGIPRVTYCDPEIASVGLTEAQAREKYGRGRDLRVQPRRQRQEPDPADPGLRQARPARRTARSSACTWSARGWASRSARPSSSSTGRPSPTTSRSSIHAHPTQNEALGEAHLALAGKPLHAHA